MRLLPPPLALSLLVFLGNTENKDLVSHRFHAVQELTQIEKTFISSVLPIMGMI